MLAIGMIAGTTLIASAQDDEADPGPVGVIAIGHSGLTAESSDPERPRQPALESSWATGTNPRGAERWGDTRHSA